MSADTRAAEATTGAPATPAAIPVDLGDTTTIELGRRCEHLIHRQLDELDTLIRETDSETTRDTILAMDAYSTHLLRAVENLLVLQGESAPELWTEPVELSEIVRTALLGLSEPDRISTAIEPMRVSNPLAAADICHLVGELLTNALDHGSDQSQVVVSGRTSADAYLLTIANRGDGPPTDALTDLNLLLAGRWAGGRVPTDRIGLSVVGLLATRHGARVNLEPGVSDGARVAIDLPAELLAPSAESSDLQSTRELAEPHPLSAMAWVPEITMTPDPPEPVAPEPELESEHEKRPRPSPLSLQRRNVGDDRAGLAWPRVLARRPVGAASPAFARAERSPDPEAPSTEAALDEDDFASLLLANWSRVLPDRLSNHHAR